MRKLFEIETDLLQLDDLLNEIEGDLSRLGEMEPAFTAWMDSLGTEEGRKLDGYVNWIKQLEMEAAAARAEAEQYMAKATTRENRVKWLKERMKQHLELTKRTKVETEAGRTIAIQKNGGKVPVEIVEGTDPNRIPEFFVRVKKEIDTDKVREELEAGGIVPFAKLGERGNHLRIR